MLGDYVAHGLYNNSTQYYQQVKGAKSCVQKQGNCCHLPLDTRPFPASGCTDADTPGACITETQLQAEIKKVMALKKWTGGLSKMFLVFTSSGESSGFDSTRSSCAYTAYCASHGSFLSGTTPVVSANEPYGDLNNCPGAGTSSPNSDPVADAAATSASHEFTEAITDPERNAWFTAQGNEVGDLYACDYGLFFTWAMPTGCGMAASPCCNGV